NTIYFLPISDLWVLSVLNSPVAWWFSWRTAVHAKDEALRFFTVFVEQFPVPEPNDEQRSLAEDAVARLADIAKAQQASRRNHLDWLKVEHEIDKPRLKLQSPDDLDSDGFITEVKKVRGKKKPLTA